MESLFEQIRHNKIKSYLLIFLFFILIGLLGAVFGYVFADSYAFGLIVAFLVALIYSLIGYYQGRNFILRISNAKKITKRDNLRLVNIVEELSIAAGLKKAPDVYVIPEKAMNAFATGKDPEHSAIAVTQGLLDRMNKEELEGVIAHEMSHIRNYDIRLMMLASVLVGVVALLSQIFIRSMWFGRRDEGEDGNLRLIMMLVGIVFAIFAPIIAQLIKLAVSRRREFLADASAAALTRYPPGLANALEKIKNDEYTLRTANTATAHLYIANPFKRGFVANLFSTHPPIDERIRRLRAM